MCYLKNKKKSLQLVGCILLILSVVLDFVSHSTSSVILTISLLFGTIASVISFFLPSSYSHLFEQKDWIQYSASSYKLSVTHKQHGMGKRPQATLYLLNEKQKYEMVFAEIEYNSQGDILVISGQPFNGCISVS